MDDDVAFLRSLERAAGARRDLELAVVPGGDAAIRHVGGLAAELAVVDVFMPDVGGLEVCRRLRAAAPRLRVMAASSHVTAELEEEARRAGASRVLPKPFGVAQLVQAAAVAEDAAQRAALIEAHLDLARNIAGRLARSYQAMLAPDDLEALARLGLCEAARRFDPSRAEPFLPFAERRIRGAVLDEVRRLGAHTRAARRRIRRISEARRALRRTHANPSDAEVAAHLGMSPDEVARARAPTRVVFAPFVDPCASPEEQPDRLAERAEALVLVAHGRRALPPLHRAIVRMRYEQEMSFAAIAKTLEMSAERVMQLHARALESLRRQVAGPRR